jgi:hypothetical protein
MALHITNIFHCKTFQNLHKFGFWVWKYLHIPSGNTTSDWLSGVYLKGLAIPKGLRPIKKKKKVFLVLLFLPDILSLQLICTICLHYNITQKWKNFKVICTWTTGIWHSLWLKHVQICKILAPYIIIGGCVCKKFFINLLIPSTCRKSAFREWFLFSE